VIIIVILFTNVAPVDKLFNVRRIIAVTRSTCNRRMCGQRFPVLRKLKEVYPTPVHKVEGREDGDGRL